MLGEINADVLNNELFSISLTGIESVVPRIELNLALGVKVSNGSYRFIIWRRF